MKKKVGSTGRYVARYGKRIRSKVLAVETLQRKKQKCPYCNRLTAKRQSIGIWECRKCENKFTSKAYVVGE